MKYWLTHNREYKREYDRHYYIKNAEKMRAKSLLWAQNNRERKRAYDKKRRAEFSQERKIQNRNNHLSRKYGLSFEKYTAMMCEQNGLCAICKRNKVLYVDHDHKTNKNRELLCRNCNTLLGHAKENVQILSAAILYLEKHLDIGIELAANSLP